MPRHELRAWCRMDPRFACPEPEADRGAVGFRCQPCSAAARLASGAAPSRLTRRGGNSEVPVMRAGRLKIMLIAAFTSAAVLIGSDVASAAAGSPAGSDAAGAPPGSPL